MLVSNFGLVDSRMTCLLKRSGRQAFGPLGQKLRNLGVDGDTELDAVLDRTKVGAAARRGDDIIAPDRSPRHSTVLLDGVACLYERLPDGTRQIYAFQYPGDFCDLHQHVLPETNNEVAVAAITDCSIGIIEHKDLEQLIAQYPSLGLALWRASMLEASIFRKRLLNVGRQPALQRVAHLLCEQLARREAVGLNSATIPLTQMDLADAAGLSIVHINRTFQELRRLNILSKEGRAITVLDRERLAGLASFDGNYLNMPQLLSHWQVKMESTLTPAERSPATWRPPTSATMLCSTPAAQRVDRKRQRLSPLVEQLRIRPPCAPALAVTPRRRKSAASLATVLIA
jgi:CRP-like cAMP-binding protein